MPYKVDISLCYCSSYSYPIFHNYCSW